MGGRQGIELMHSLHSPIGLGLREQYDVLSGSKLTAMKTITVQLFEV